MEHERVCGRLFNHEHVLFTVKERKDNRQAGRTIGNKKKKETRKIKNSHWHQSGTSFVTSVSCPLGAHQGQRQLCSDVREAWQRLNSVALHHVSREMRGCRAWPGVKGRNCALSELRSNYRRLNPLTLRRVMKGSADSFETPRRGYLFVNVRLLKLEQREEEGGRGHQWGSYLLVSHVSCGKHVSPSALIVKSRSIVRVPRNAENGFHW